MKIFLAGPGEHDPASLGGGLEVSTDLATVADVDIVAISTRLPRAELAPLVTAVTAATSAPMVALAHTGGEEMAVEILRAGGVAVVAEGNEAALAVLLSGGAYDQSMVDTYDRQIGQAVANPMRGRDRVTGLAGTSVFTQRIEELHTDDDVPRVMILRLIGLANPGGTPLPPEATELLRRRLSSSFAQLVLGTDAELYSLDDDEFGVISPTMSASRAERLARGMALVVETYAPVGNRALALAAGHAGPEAPLDAAPILEIVGRALDVAAGEQQTAIVSAETLALDVSSTTELEAALHAAATVERRSGGDPEHGQRVAAWSSEIAGHLGLQGQTRTRVRLAGLLHDVGRVALPQECFEPPESLTGDLLEAHRSHPARGADWLRISAGREVADAIRSHHERWDGRGYPDGLEGDAIPLAARIIRVAEVFTRLREGTDPGVSGPLPPAEALAALEQRAGSELDPTVVDIALPVLDKLESGGS